MGHVCYRRYTIPFELFISRLCLNMKTNLFTSICFLSLDSEEISILRIGVKCSLTFVKGMD